MQPRVHNIASYSLAMLVFAGSAAFCVASNGSAGVEPGAIVGTAMWCVHFLRRAGESAWVHRYGKRGVPPADALVEYVYYGGFAAWNAAALYSTSYHSPDLVLMLLGGAVFLAGELGNAKAHRMLRDLRPAGSAKRRVPRGFFFERISCPHYLFEILAWIGFACATQTWAALSFLLLGAGILGAWARTRHVAYRAEFDGRDGRELYPAERRALIPGIF